MGMRSDEQTIRAIVAEWHFITEKVFFVKTEKLPPTKKGEHGMWEWYYDGKVIFYNKKESAIESL